MPSIAAIAVVVLLISGAIGGSPVIVDVLDEHGIVDVPPQASALEHVGENMRRIFASDKGSWDKNIATERMMEAEMQAHIMERMSEGDVISDHIPLPHPRGLGEIMAEIDTLAMDENIVNRVHATMEHYNVSTIKIIIADESGNQRILHIEKGVGHIWDVDIEADVTITLTVGQVDKILKIIEDGEISVMEQMKLVTMYPRIPVQRGGG